MLIPIANWYQTVTNWRSQTPSSSRGASSIPAPGTVAELVLTSGTSIPIRAQHQQAWLAILTARELATLHKIVHRLMSQPAPE
jgi:hypothetical protein